MTVCLIDRPSEEVDVESEVPGEADGHPTPDLLACELDSYGEGDPLGVGPLVILIAEDEALLAFSLKGSLQRQGHEVVGIAGSGGEAVALTCQHRPDVVLMDVQMPEMTGLEATRLLMEEFPTCVVVVTAYADAEAAALAVGAMGYAVKPLTASQVPRVLAKAQRRFARYQELLRDSASPQEALERWLVIQSEVG